MISPCQYREFLCSANKERIVSGAPNTSDLAGDIDLGQDILGTWSFP